jgi:hypothetical protein
MSQKIVNLENRLGYKFQNLALLERAVTHRSWAYERLPDGDEERVRQQQNESLEFVGDSVLGLAIAEQLYLRHPNSSEGDLTLMKHHLVSAETLARLALSLNLGDFIRIGRGEEKNRRQAQTSAACRRARSRYRRCFFRQRLYFGARSRLPPLRRRAAPGNAEKLDRLQNAFAGNAASRKTDRADLHSR